MVSAEESDENSPTYQRLYAAARYLDYLAPDAKGYINIRHGPKRPEVGEVNPHKNEFFSADEIEAAAQRAVWLAEMGHDVYAAIAPRKTNDKKVAGTKNGILHCWGLYADVDSPGAHERLASSSGKSGWAGEGS